MLPQFHTDITCARAGSHSLSLLPASTHTHSHPDFASKPHSRQRAELGACTHSPTPEPATSTLDEPPFRNSLPPVFIQRESHAYYASSQDTGAMVLKQGRGGPPPAGVQSATTQLGSSHSPPRVPHYPSFCEPRHRILSFMRSEIWSV